MANIGDFVVYGNSGICEISGSEVKIIAGRKFTYYVLKPVYDKKATVFVPSDNQALCDKMRKPLTKEEICNIIDSISKQECVWVENESDRKTQYREVISSGDRTELIKLVKTLYLHQSKQFEKGKKLHIADEKFLTTAERLLYDEFAFVLGIERDSVIDFITSRIDK